MWVLEFGWRSTYKCLRVQFGSVPATLFVMRKPHGEWKSLPKSFSYCSRSLLARETIIIIAAFFCSFFFLSLSCVPKWNHWFRVTCQSQYITSIVAAKHQSLGFYLCLKIVQKNHTKICMLACGYCWKSIKKTKAWIPSICFQDWISWLQ